MEVPLTTAVTAWRSEQQLLLATVATAVAAGAREKQLLLATVATAWSRKKALLLAWTRAKELLLLVTTATAWIRKKNLPPSPSFVVMRPNSSRRRDVSSTGWLSPVDDC